MKAKTKKMLAGVLGYVGRSVVGFVKHPVVQAGAAAIIKHKVKSGVAAGVIVAAVEVIAGVL